MVLAVLKCGKRYKIIDKPDKKDLIHDPRDEIHLHFCHNLFVDKDGKEMPDGVYYIKGMYRVSAKSTENVQIQHGYRYTFVSKEVYEYARSFVPQEHQYESPQKQKYMKLLEQLDRVAFCEVCDLENQAHHVYWSSQNIQNMSFWGYWYGDCVKCDRDTHTILHILLCAGLGGIVSSYLFDKRFERESRIDALIEKAHTYGIDLTITEIEQATGGIYGKR